MKFTLMVLCSLMLFIPLGKALPLSQMTRKVHRVGLFTGTFDPLHLAHQSIVEETLKSGSVDAVVIVPNGDPRHKPNATKIQQRLDMIEKVYAKSKNVFYPDQPADCDAIKISKDWQQKKFDIKLYKIAGEDVFQNGLQREQPLGRSESWPFEAYIVFSRGLDQKTKSYQEFQGKPVLHIEMKMDNYSSSFVRENINSMGMTFLDREIQNFILKNQLYGAQSLCQQMFH